MNRGDHNNKHLQRAWIRDSPEAFTFGIIEETDVERIAEREQFYLDNASPGSLYNANPIAYRPPSPKGIPKSPEHRARISAAHIGKTLDPEHSAKFTSAGRLASNTPEAIAKARQTRHERYGYALFRTEPSRHYEASGTYAFVSPDGIIHTTSNLHRFAQENGINGPNLWRVAHKKRKSTNGWTLYDGTRHPQLIMGSKGVIHSGGSV